MTESIVVGAVAWVKVLSFSLAIFSVQWLRSPFIIQCTAELTELHVYVKFVIQVQYCT